MMMISVSVGIF